MKKNRIVALVLCLVTPLMAAEKVKLEGLTNKAQAPAIYEKMEKGKRLSLIYKDSTFDPSMGFKPGAVEYRAEERMSEIVSYLKTDWTEVGKKDSPYTLDLYVLEATPYKATKFYFGSDSNSSFVIEGLVKDGLGKVVASFVTKEYGTPGGLGAGVSLRPSLDKMVSGITSELFKK